MVPHAPVISVIVWKGDVLLPATYVQPVIQQYHYDYWNEITIAAQPYYYWWIMHTTSKQWHCVPQLSSEKKMLHWQLCSTHYTAVQTCNQSSPYENYGRFLLQMEAILCLPQNWHFSWWAKMNGRALVSPWRMHCVYSGMAKGTSRAEATSNSEKIEPVALAMLSNTNLKASVSHSVSQPASQSVGQSVRQAGR